VKETFFIAYCYETITLQYAIITDNARAQPIGRRLGLRTWAQASG